MGSILSFSRVLVLILSPRLNRPVLTAVPSHCINYNYIMILYHFLAAAFWSLAPPSGSSNLELDKFCLRSRFFIFLTNSFHFFLQLFWISSNRCWYSLFSQSSRSFFIALVDDAVTIISAEVIALEFVKIGTSWVVTISLSEVQGRPPISAPTKVAFRLV